MVEASISINALFSETGKRTPGLTLYFLPIRMHQKGRAMIDGIPPLAVFDLYQSHICHIGTKAARTGKR
jgi:hypothetical protein